METCDEADLCRNFCGLARHRIRRHFGSRPTDGALPHWRAHLQAAPQNLSPEAFQDLTICPTSQYPGPADHPVVNIRCEPLPPAGNAEVAKVYADNLQDLRVCPAGKFPKRYSDGKDLRPGEKCVRWPANFHDLPDNVDRPMSDPGVAHSNAYQLSTVAPCPYGMDWQAAPTRGSGYPDPPPPPPEPGIPPPSYDVGQPSKSGDAATTAPQASSPTCTSSNNSAGDNSSRCYVHLDAT